MTDQELLRAYVVERNVECLGTFFRRYQEAILRFVTRLIGDADAAQDVVQETFLEVARHPKRVLAVESCHNWLLRVARNIGMNHLRGKVRERRHSATIADHSRHIARARQTEVGSELENAETRQQVRTQIERLPTRQREILLLRVQESKSYKEIAEITGLTATNVGFILHQTMKTLSPRLHRQGGDLR